MFALGVELAASNKVCGQPTTFMYSALCTLTKDWMQSGDSPGPVLLPGSLLLDAV